MTSNWVKECGVDVGGCDWCLMTEIANDRLAKEVAEGEELAVELAQERARYRREARHWKNVSALALTALAGVFVLVVVGWVR
tara:strand:+ start:559 stop:804 length:246 start_codon:yes stop_codon:yes gene_type:complete